MGNQPITIIDIAKIAGVAPGTVSRVINNKGYIKTETREKVKKALADMNYIPNRAGRTLKTTRTGLIMLAIPDTANAIYIGMIEAVQEYVDGYGYSMVLYYTNGGLDNEMKAIRMLREHLVDGLFLVHFSYHDELLAAIDSCNMPIVLCGMCNHLWADGCIHGFSTISIDVYHAIAQITSEMIRYGHRKIAYLAGTFGLPVYSQRYEAYSTVLSEHGINVDDSIVFWSDYTKENGRRAAKDIIALKNPPTAVVASNDLQALGFWEEYTSHGFRIPENIALSGLDNLDEMKLLHLSTICMKEREIGKAGAEILTAQLTRGTYLSARHIRFTPELIIRDSIQSPRV